MPGHHALKAHRLLLQSALSLSGAFAWIFIFEYFYFSFSSIREGFIHTLLLYAFSQAISCLVAPYALVHVRKSLRRVMIYGTVACAGAYVFLGALFSGYLGDVVPFALIDFAFLTGLYRALYRVPYVAEREATAPIRHFGFSDELLLAILPAFTGFALTLKAVPETYALYASAALAILALFPLSGLPDVYEHFPWSYHETFVQLFNRAHRAFFLRAFFDGVQGAVLLLIWPIAVFLLVGWSYLLFGLVLSAAALLTIALEPIVRQSLRNRGPLSTHARVSLAVFAWIGRFLVATPFGVVLIDAYARLSGHERTHTRRLLFEQVADSGLYVDEYTALRDIGLMLGRIALCAVAIFAAFADSLGLAFAISFLFAAFAAGYSVALSSRA